MTDLRTLTDDLLSRTDLAADRLNTTALQGAITGLAITERASLRSSLEELQGLTQFDCIESGGSLVFRPRGGAVVVTVAPEDLLPLSKDGHGPVQVTRQEEAGLPQALDLVYLDPARDYQAVTASALRHSAPAASTKTVRFGAVVNSDQARQTAAMLLDTAWAERFSFQCALPPKYLFLEVGDVVILPALGRQWTVRVVRSVYERGRLTLDGVSTDAATYSQSATAFAPGTAVSVVIAGTSTLFALDIPLVDESDDSAGYFLAVTKTRGDTRWQYATVFESLDGGAVYEPRTVLPLEAVTGTANTVLSGVNAPTAYCDDKNTVDVTVYDGVLASAVELSLLNGANAAALGQEIIQFGSAVLIGTNTYRLSHLLRGRRGTEWAMSSHALNERFVLLGVEVIRQPLSSSQIGIERLFKGVSNGGVLEDTASVPFTPLGASLKPFAPVHIKGERNGTGDVTVSWIRRSRASGGWTDYADVQLFEDSECYEVDILDAGGSVVRTLTVSGMSQAIYTAAEQTADFGAVQITINVAVYQVSAAVGRGSGAVSVV